MQIKSKTKTDSGEVNHVATVSQSSSGQTVLHVISTLGASRHEHQISLGAVDAEDAIATMNNDQMTTSLQETLNSVRSNAASILNGRFRVAKLVANLK
jgi:hypothetical protein